MENFEKRINLVNVEGVDLQFDGEGFVRFGDVASRLLYQQSQYASRYIDGTIDGYPNLGVGLKFKGDSSNYHGVRIHKDDVLEFVIRVRGHKESSD